MKRKAKATKRVRKFPAYDPLAAIYAQERSAIEATRALITASDVFVRAVRKVIAPGPAMTSYIAHAQQEVARCLSNLTCAPEE